MNADSVYGHAEQGVTVTPSQLSRLLCNPTVPTCPPPLPASPVPPVPSSPPPLPRVPLPSSTGPVRHEAPSNMGGTTIPSIPMPAAAAGCSSRPGKWTVWRNHRSRFSKHRPRIACGLVAAHGGAGCTTILRSSPASYANAGRRCPSAVTPHNPAVSCCARCARGAGSKRPAHCWTRGGADCSGRPSFLGLR